ncbi:pyrroline-5-carboxylate reductase [Shouchella clausii]|uniref:Pyrroline-5-carboxylate reductase n=1 Tax=Shouchella clausii TaxID=79880 RepID=A0A268RV67_SHOCL|nr:pyrroline-5-carboxylate reductase [Shouchella clausii]PAD41351.1 pyrroline-5-carboxylate reductase [Bacillus sp. 7520-S]PAD09578.1 pyrroline-5-carboxylate reductase [Shouchella clausii]PAE84370.1 pyrroline-5-carboxylate reductase [Shouchella clausii]PAE92825.1 pyrroline-5-carboxylate reductase [Shouchella clausii]PAF05776.1 pyrroline-5-carboxylate reductase [Shouchella clausii]
MTNQTTVAILGAGSMAEALIGGIARNNGGKAPHITVLNANNRKRLNQLHTAYGVHAAQSYEEAVKGKDVIVLAIKPHNVQEVADLLVSLLNPQKQLVISVAAGIKLETLESWLPAETAVIRAMPNTSARVLASATTLSIGTYATEWQLAFAKTLFSSIGTVTVVDEQQMDAATGVAGSGPAYIYYVAEAMLNAAIAEGLSPTEARALINQTIGGAAKQLSDSSKSPKDLYKEIMSPNGTTEAAIAHLDRSSTQELFQQAIHQAVKRSAAIGASFERDAIHKHP